MKAAVLLLVAASTADRDEEHRAAVERSQARAAKASRLLADHGHLLPPDLLLRAEPRWGLCLS